MTSALSLLRADETEVLRFLALSHGYDFNYSGFGDISANTGLDRATVRDACRSLASKGFADFRSGLWSEDDRPAGAGYCCTKAGAEVIERLDRAIEKEMG